jgi:hypothetical protein
MTRAIFRSTSQALHFAYMIEAYETSVESIMAKAMRRLMKELGIWNTGAPSTVDFDGLNAMEVRAQCAMIRATVKDRLPRAEAWAIQAIYGINERRVDAGGTETWVFSHERRAAIQSLTLRLRPNLQNFSPVAIYMMVSRVVDSRSNVTFRQMSERFGLNQTTYSRGLKRIRDTIFRLERMGISRLERTFIAEGLAES